MPFPHLKGLTALAVGLMACQGGPVPGAGALPPASQAVPRTTLLRLPRGGGTPKLYDGAALTDIGWRIRGRTPPVQLAVGFDQDQGLAYAVDSAGGLQALDVTTGATRVLTQQVRGVVLGPEGTLWVVDDKDGIVRIRRRTAVRLEATLPRRPTALYGTGDRQLLAVEAGDTARAVLVTGAPPDITTDLPSSSTAASPWGDLLAATAPTGVYLWAPKASTPLQRVRVSGTPTSVRFSASGHRIYVGREARNLAVIDRYAGERVDDIEMPGSAAALRVAPYGGWLLARPADGDSLWVINLGTGKYAGVAAGPWGADLPTVFGDATLLTREGKDVVARDLAREGFPETGRLKGAAADLFLPMAWVPPGSQPEVVTAQADAGQPAPAPDDRDLGPGPPEPQIALVYLQVSRSQNPAWAQALATEMRDDGFPAQVLTPKPGEEAYRVVVGPYPSREAAESAGRLLGRPSFIYQP
ncbi:MAG TPA: SPOR domain-containing protein [Gemmatimonadales bacterium]|nr:SPOR domain-containing protein [Gemmatimonadales bacterium]